METLLSPRKPVKRFRQRGFTLIEMMVSILVLTIGLVGTAALMSSSVNMGAHARYASTAALLASEKMEDLDRYPDNDPNLVGGGSLTGDITGYSDAVQISSSNGNINETTTNAGLTTLYTQRPDGTVVVTAGGSLPATTPDMLTFDRRWQIVPNPVVGGNTITGAVQITVLVTLTNKSLNPPVTYQTSLVHP
ncbi:MAG TPA: prepilin-type N-terminal cleavage/methylation domain-containing protein [Candidatus Acidoferrum sp.]|jgi:type IV pilus assembly protein PilV|nr:prepilin-type N-terminal cleavage/methylation domain-containing protein [Candidatus Acidoferrum sp.]